MKRLTIARVMPMIGASQKTVAAGLLNPIFLSRRRSCVKLHLRPPRALALITMIKPFNTKWVSVATIRRIPENIRSMTAIRCHENISKRKTNANKRTKMREEDLHIAIIEYTSVVITGVALRTYYKTKV